MLITLRIPRLTYGMDLRCKAFESSSRTAYLPAVKWRVRSLVHACCMARRPAVLRIFSQRRKIPRRLSVYNVVILEHCT